MDSQSKIHLGLDHELYGEGYRDPFIKNEDKLSLTEIIPRILHERQSFLNITEDSLMKEIEEQEEAEREAEGRASVGEGGEGGGEEGSGNTYDANGSLGVGAADGGAGGPGGAAVVGTLESFQAQKHEFTRNISTALNETSLSLDFVSLLISAVKPNIGKTTMSPHLSKAVPLGSLSADKVELSGPNDSKQNSEIGQGLKLEALSKITESFRDASARLGAQVGREQRYWESIHTVRANGEVLYKTRDPTTGYRAIGVKYGFGDSGSSYHDRGLAVLKRDDATGSVSLLPILATGSGIKVADKVYKYIRVKILSKIDDDYMLTGQSIFNSASIRRAASGGAAGAAGAAGASTTTTEDPILNEIEKIRYFLFEEDLFYQLTREAKTLINYNVSIIANKIIIEVHDHILEIESVYYDESNEDELNNLYQNINRESSMNNGKAQQILIFLKLMLCCFYRYNLALRQGVPTARTRWKLANSHPLILRPLLGYLRHEINYKNIVYIVDSITAAYDARLYRVSSRKYSTLQPIRDTRRVQDIFEKATKSPTSEIAIKLKHARKGTVLRIALNLSATETFCNLIVSISIVKYDNDRLENGSKVLESQVSEIYDVEECLKWVVSKFMSS